MSSPWTKKDIPSQKGKVAIVTGSYGGLGYETVLGLAEAGAEVIIAGRTESKGKEAIDKIKAICPDAKVSFSKVDLSSLKSVTEFCKDFNSKHQVLDLLINNAGVMMPPNRLTTEDGFEIQLGTNHLAHFALTAQLLPALRRSSGPGRIVNVSSMAARQGGINFDDLQSEKSYSPWKVYGQSKLANLLFTFELQRRSEKEGWGVIAIAAHPGYSRSDLIKNGPGENSFFAWMGAFFGPIFSQSCADGALPQLFAATSPDAKPSGYYGPQGFREMKGIVGTAMIPTAASDTEVAKKFWDVSVNLTKVEWP